MAGLSGTPGEPRLCISHQGATAQLFLVPLVPLPPPPPPSPTRTTTCTALFPTLAFERYVAPTPCALRQPETHPNPPTSCLVQNRFINTIVSVVSSHPPLSPTSCSFETSDRCVNFLTLSRARSKLKPDYPPRSAPFGPSLRALVRLLVAPPSIGPHTRAVHRQLLPYDTSAFCEHIILVRTLRRHPRLYVPILDTRVSPGLSRSIHNSVG